MRIALFHNTPSGGAKRAIYEWTRRLSTRHDIDVYTLTSADHNFCDIRPFVQAHHVFEFTPRKIFGSPWGRLNKLQRWRDLGELLRIGRHIAGTINTGKYDIVFANTCLYTYVPAFLQFVQTPAIYYLHEPFGPLFVRQFQRPYIKTQQWQAFLNRLDPFIHLYGRRLNAIQKNSVHGTRRLLANSRFTKERMEMAFETDTQLCCCGVDTDIFHPLTENRKENFVLSVGELSPRKGFDFLLESLAHIPHEKRPLLKLACNMVNDQERSYIQALAEQHKVELQILTKLNVDQLRLEYNRAQMCIYAPVMEPFGLVPLEAMACGTPVVGVREGGVQESIVHEQTGLLVERNPVRFAAAVQSLLSNPGLAQEYGQNGREHVLRSWTWDQAVDALEKHLVACAEVALRDLGASVV